MRMIVAPIKIDRATVQDGLDDLEIFAQMPERGVEVKPIHPFHVGPMAGTQAETKATGSQLSQHLDLLHHH